VAAALLTRSVPTPVDPALPRLRVLLDADAMASFLRRSLAADAPVPEVRVHHVRYQPGRKAVVRYDVGLDGRRYDAVAVTAGGRRYLARRAGKPESVALARLVDGRSPARMPLRFEPELDALIQWYPLDLELPALAEPPERLLGELEAAGISIGEVEADPSTLAYKPRRRAVLRVGEHVLKIYAKEEELAASVAGLRAASAAAGVRTAALEGALPTRLVTVQSLLAGPPPAPEAAAGEAGKLLRELHAADEAGLYVAGPSHQLAVAEQAAAYITAILPALGDRLKTFLRALEATMPADRRFVFSHGDFSARQLLVTPDGLAVVDFDARRRAPAALDLATYTAHVVSGGRDHLEDAYGVLEELLEGYGGRPPGISWYLAACLLRHARSPFRYFDERWPERVEGMVEAAEAALRR
jgi:hypothetical protein